MFPVVIVVAIWIAFLACAFISFQRFYHDVYPHASPDLCRTIFKSLRENPGDWTGASGNPLIPDDFQYTITHKDGTKLWIANGRGFLAVWRPSQMYIPVRWKFPMWRAFKKNKHRMQTSSSAATA